MFLTGYLLIVLLAAIPFIRTLRRDRQGEPSVVFLHRLYRDLGYIAAAIVAIIIFETVLSISLENLWFGEIGQRR